MRYAEIAEQVHPGSRFPIALNTPMDQIPLTLPEAKELLAALEAAIWQAEGRQEERNAA